MGICVQNCTLDLSAPGSLGLACGLELEMQKSWHDEGVREDEGCRSGAFGVMTLPTMCTVTQNLPWAVTWGDGHGTLLKGDCHSESSPSSQSSREDGCHFTSLQYFD